MNEATAKRHVKHFLEDLMRSASYIQNNPDRIARIIMTDHHTYKELGKLTSDLFSLIDVIEADAAEEARKEKPASTQRIAGAEVRGQARGEAMTRDEAVRAAKAAGYQRVNTAGGPVDLDDWQPYGATKGDPRTAYPVRFTLIEDKQNPRIEDVTPAGSIGGIWQLGV